MANAIRRIGQEPLWLRRGDLEVFFLDRRYATKGSCPVASDWLLMRTLAKTRCGEAAQKE